MDNMNQNSVNDSSNDNTHKENTANKQSTHDPESASTNTNESSADSTETTTEQETTYPYTPPQGKNSLVQLFEKLLAHVCSSLLGAAIVIGFLFLSFVGTEQFALERSSSWGVSELMTDLQIVDELTFADGFTNAFAVFGKTIVNTLIIGINEYIYGFEFGAIGNIFWSICGALWVIAKHTVLIGLKYLISLYYVFFQSGGTTLEYWFGFVAGNCILFAIEGNVDGDIEKFKKWSKRKIIGTIIAAFLIIIIAVNALTV